MLRVPVLYMQVMQADEFHLHLQKEAQFLPSLHIYHHHCLLQEGCHHVRAVRPLSPTSFTSKAILINLNKNAPIGKAINHFHWKIA